MYINEIAKKYQKLYLLLTKEEKITIFSATVTNPLLRIYPLKKETQSLKP
jgi:hypothetical protein